MPLTMLKEVAKNAKLKDYWNGKEGRHNDTHVLEANFTNLNPETHRNLSREEDYVVKSLKKKGIDYWTYYHGKDQTLKVVIRAPDEHVKVIRESLLYLKKLKRQR